MSMFVGRAEPPRTLHGHDAPIEIEMYEIGEDGNRVDPPPPPPRRTIEETLESWRRALDAVQERARIANSPGGRALPQVDFPTLTGFREDVQATLHADPRAATDAALEHGFLERGFKGLRIDPSSMRTHKTELSWSVSLRTSPWRRRPATLRLSPAPSFHVTVFRLTPVKSQRIATRAFIRAGLRGTFELINRLDREVAARGSRDR